MSRGEVHLCFFDRLHDIAILRIPERGGGFLVPPEARAVSENSEVIAIGHTDGVPWRDNYGLLGRRLTMSDQLKSMIGVGELKVDFVACDVSLGEGSSGGVVLDKAGNLIGMVHGALSHGPGATVLLIPRSDIASALASASSGRSCNLNPLTYSGYLDGARAPFALLPVVDTAPTTKPVRSWIGVARLVSSDVDGYSSGANGFQITMRQQLPAIWALSASAHISDDSNSGQYAAGVLSFQDKATLKSWGLQIGPELMIREFWRFSVFAVSGVGIRHDAIKHDYVPSSGIFATQEIKEAQFNAWENAGIRGELNLERRTRVYWTMRWWATFSGRDGVDQAVGIGVGL